MLGLVGSWLGFAGLGLALVTGAVVAMATPAEPQAASAAPVPTQADCRQPAAFASLAALPPTRIMAPIDLGAHLLLFTPHAVVAAPYHRDQAGVRDTFRFFNDPIEAAHQILSKRGVDLVVICPGMPELHGLPDAAADSFVRRLPENRLPAWLTEITTPGDTRRVFRVAS
jgi:1,6-anhydro-N-acetylmuramate kinase